MYYRYEFINKCKYPHTGIIEGLLEVFEDELEFPDPKKINAQTPSELSDTRCFFTEKGNGNLIDMDIETFYRQSLIRYFFPLLHHPFH